MTNMNTKPETKKEDVKSGTDKDKSKMGGGSCGC